MLNEDFFKSKDLFVSNEKHVIMQLIKKNYEK